MAYCFRNLVFEGGGVKGLAYLGAMQVLANEGILDNIVRVGGTSAGAINALLTGLNFPIPRMEEIMRALDFHNFEDSNFLNMLPRIFSKFGINSGDYFVDWIKGLLKERTGIADPTFADIQRQKEEKKFRDMYFIGTDLSTGFSLVFSHELYPDMKVADALRISMSIPFFFTAVKRDKDYFGDGGILNNYPIQLFDFEQYLSSPANGKQSDYHSRMKKLFAQSKDTKVDFIYNAETLGFRLDSEEEIKAFNSGSQPSNPIKNVFDYTYRVVMTLKDFQANLHLRSEDWHRTIYIDTKGVKTTDFDIEPEKKNELIESGRKNTKIYIDWFNNPNSERPFNKV